MQQAFQIPRLAPDLRLFGPVNDNMLSEFLRQQEEAPVEGRSSWN